MNIHPVLVHYPVAFLSIYAFFELLRFKKLQDFPGWLFIKATLVFVGGLGVLAALSTGDFGKALYPAQRAIIRVHENFADMTVAVFGIIALIYLVAVLDVLFADYFHTSKFAATWQRLADFDKKLNRGVVLIPLALIGLFLLLTTGALGGSIVYGVNSDLFTQIANQVFVH
jgi:uncharacterized membrane protein